MVHQEAQTKKLATWELWEVSAVSIVNAAQSPYLARDGSVDYMS
jgi:hypothetical protein